LTRNCLFFFNNSIVVVILKLLFHFFIDKHIDLFYDCVVVWMLIDDGRVVCFMILNLNLLLLFVSDAIRLFFFKILKL
jgi:hypothetical protein